MTNLIEEAQQFISHKRFCRVGPETPCDCGLSAFRERVRTYFATPAVLPDARARVREVSERLLTDMRAIARQDGWALASHGSMSRDLDLIAVPWTDEATDETAFVEAMRASVARTLGGIALIGAGEDGRTPGVKAKPHGRRAWTIHSTSEQLVETEAGAHPYVDLCVLDLRITPPASDAAVPAGMVTTITTKADQCDRLAEVSRSPACFEYRAKAQAYREVIAMLAAAPKPANDAVVSAGEYEARFVVGGAPTDCVDYGVVSLSKGKEVCRVWEADDARLIANLLNTAAAPKVASDTGAGLRDIAAERQRQIEDEGWTPEHDDRHNNRSIATAAACYTMFAAATDEARNTTDLPGSLASLGKPIRGWAAFLQIWPWDRRWWKPTSRRADLVKAGALIIAEIERLDRKEAARG